MNRLLLTAVVLLFAGSSFGHVPPVAHLELTKIRLELSPGSHQLQTEVAHPSGQFTTNITSSFTNNIVNHNAADSFDPGGYLTNRVWKNGTNVVRTQTFWWDARGRLIKVTDLDTNSSGLNWSAVYDPLDRLLRTTEITVTNGTVLSSQAVVIEHYYDPEVEFLEVGVNENGHVTWMGED